MLKPLRFLTRRLTSTDFDVRCAQLAFWVASIGIFAIGVSKLASLQLSEAELFFGVLLLVVAAFQFIILSFVLPITALGKRANAKTDD